MTNADMVREFHDKFSLESDTNIDETFSLVSLRCKLLKEEFDEVMVAFASESKYQVAKELCDLLYVTYGALIAFGMDPDKCFAEVHRSNMSKLTKEGEVLYREDGKVMKSDQYSPADLTKIF